MRRLLSTFAALALLTACGPGEVGDACQGGALEGVCVDGAICAPERSTSVEPPEEPNDERYTCRAICEVEADCPEGETCRRVVGSMLSACQPVDAASDPTEGDPTGME